MALVALISLSLVLFFFSSKNTTLTQAQCLPDQRHSLIQLKQGFNTTQLHSWNASKDCCIWDGITCDEKTGMVTALNLFDMGISGEINPALFNLTSLRDLNLAWNHFDNLSLPQTGFEQLSNLTHLDLAYSGFVGQVPISISSLTNLISLDLSSNMNLYEKDLKTILRNLTKLQALHLDWVDIQLNGSEWGKAIFQIGPTLQELTVENCGIRGNLPDEIFHLTNLTKLDLSFNSMLMSGELPKFMKLNLLQSLHLSGTNLAGPLPYSIGNLKYLSILLLFNCNISGEIPPSITNLTRLEKLDLSSNRLTGTIPLSLFSHPSLEHLVLRDNQLSGYLPEYSNGSSILEIIYLEENNLQGQLSISKFIKNQKSLLYLDLSNNNLSIIEDENHNESFYASFPQLEYLYLESCSLIKFPFFLNYQTNIYSLGLSNNFLIGEIPLSISNVTILKLLDLSYNNLTGTIPPWLLEHAKLEVLNLKSNKLSGSLPQNISQACELQTINLNGNFLNGSLPKLLMNCNSLEILDLGNNQIVNRFPYWLGNLKNLRVLILRSNMFYGKVSDVKIKRKGNDYFFPMLKALDLSSNHFSGTLPQNIFVNMKAMMGESNSSSQYFSGMNLSYYSHGASVTYKGLNFDLLFSLGIFSYIDMSNNEFWGIIPEEIGQLKSLDVLNLSHNALTGSIPQEFANLQQLQILDLSSNQLSEHIPQELTSLTFLSELNLSYNNLFGEIPEARQFSTFSNDSYLGNPGLCGSPLSMQCVPTPAGHGFSRGFPSKPSIDIIGLSFSFGLGLGVGFAFVILTTVAWENGRRQFNFIIDRFYIQHFH